MQKNEILPDLILSQSDLLHGAGRRSGTVVAGRAFKKGEKIQDFTGKRYSEQEILENKVLGARETDDPFQVSRHEYIILDEIPLKFNHSCSPNAGIRKEIELVAIHDIQAGEEIRYDYSTTVHPDVTANLWTMQCCCGSANCRKDIQNILTIAPAQLQFYLEADVIPAYLKALVQEQLLAGWSFS